MISQNYIRKREKKKKIEFYVKSFSIISLLALIASKMNVWCDKAMVHVVFNRHMYDTHIKIRYLLRSTVKLDRHKKNEEEKILCQHILKLLGC